MHDQGKLFILSCNITASARQNRKDRSDIEKHCASSGADHTVFHKETITLTIYHIFAKR